jgi:hypothetical protein
MLGCSTGVIGSEAAKVQRLMLKSIDTTAGFITSLPGGCFLNFSADRIFF